MASPHVEGAGALLTALRRTGSPAEIRSALAATAETGILEETAPLRPTHSTSSSGRIDLDGAGRAGAGHGRVVRRLPAAADPGGGGDPAGLNLPAFVDGTCVGTCAWTRTVRNVADVPAE